MTSAKKVLILGGGFGGVKAALELAGDERFSISLLSDQNNFRYYPQLYRTATGGNRTASEIPLAEIFAAKSVQLIRDSAQHLDRQSKKISGSSGKIYGYDILIVALGVVTNYYGIEGLAQHAYGIKTQAEAAELKAHLHKLITDEGKPDLNYVVIGGGSTGVELAGALPGYLEYIMRRHGVPAKSLRVDLVEAENRLLPRMPKSYSYAVAKRLRRLGVKLSLSQKVEAETADALRVSGHDIKSHTVVWTAGVTNHPFLKNNNFQLNDHGKAVVNEYLEAGNNIYVIGDNAGTPFSGMAQTALYDAVFMADNLKRLADSKNRQAYKPKKPIYITPVGRHWAAVQWGNLHIYGWLGWLLRNAADFMAYRDLQPWWKASKHWQATFENEESCKICEQ